MMMAKKLPVAAMFVLSASVLPAVAQEPGSVDAGYRLAKEVCAACHAIEPDDAISPNLDAPTFHEIANKPAMTAIALSVWFRTPHPTMPNFVISPAETSDLAAYILSLKSQ